MSESYVVILGITLPWLGTILGSALVFSMGKSMDLAFHKAMLGLAAGVMMAASVWSLLIPAINMTETIGGICWIPPVVGFSLGMLFLLLLDNITQTLEVTASNTPRSNNLLILAVTLHNLPEGMAVGVSLAGMLSGDLVTTTAALCLTMGIAIQNFPEGAIISLPLSSSGKCKGYAFMVGLLSGIVEPMGAVITLLLTSLVTPILPYILSFAAGCMIFVVVKELVPTLSRGKGSNWGICGTTIGFALMMLLDIALQ